MARALELREVATHRTSPNPLVGCVVVREGRIVGEGVTQRTGHAHAEVMAILAAGEAARGADVYVTLEPCCHHGRTPPCTDALIAAGVARVFAGVVDPNPLVAGRGMKQLADAGVETAWGPLSSDAIAGSGARVENIPGDGFGGLHLPSVLERLAALGHVLVVVEGGGRLHGALLEARCADELCQYVAPVIIGEGRPAFALKTLTSLTSAVRLDDVEFTTLAEDVRIRGRIRYPSPQCSPDSSSAVGSFLVASATGLTPRSRSGSKRASPAS